MTAAAVAALAAIFILIALGATLRRADAIGEAGWQAVERLTYVLFLPALLVQSTAGVRLPPGDMLRFALCLGIAVVAITVGMFALRRFIAHDARQFGSVVQGAVRLNSYVGLALAPSLGGEALGLAALGTALLVVLGNAVSVATLSRHAPQPVGAAMLGFTILRNPLVLACALGGLLAALQWPLPGIVASTLRLLGAAALPLGLMTVGAALQLRGAGAGDRALLVAAAVKLLVLPAATFAIGAALALPPIALAVAVMLQALPTAASSYVLARRMDGDADLMARIITVETLLAMPTLPLWLWLLR